MSEIVETYTATLKRKFATGEAGEHAYRGALETLFESLADINAINEANRTEVGIPDFVFIDGDVTRGYGEAKDLGFDLDAENTQAQADRYANASTNMMLTNELEFRFYKNGEVYRTIIIGEKAGDKLEFFSDKFEKLTHELEDFLARDPESIKSAKRLAKVMADKARLLRDVVAQILEKKAATDIHTQLKAFRATLMKGLSKEEFADMYAQTIAYGLFAARYEDDTPESFSRHEAHELIPHSNPFLRKFFHHIAGPDFDRDLAKLIDDLVTVFRTADVNEMMHAEFQKKNKDPMMHFYETFLGEYDKKLRKSRGVYYTPQEVVSFIVRSTDEILKDTFDITDGLADKSKIKIKKKVQAVDGRTKDKIKQVDDEVHRVQILDPAVGTGTFLHHVITEIGQHFEGQEGRFQSYVDEDLLPRLHGFELLMAPYTMAHLKLGATLSELGYKHDHESGAERLGVYLTNSLEEGVREVPNIFMAKWLSKESKDAAKVKNDTPVMCVLGNPPYSGISKNNGDWIMGLIEDYKYVDGEHFGERKHWLGDDYVKFIRLAEKQVEETGEGVVAMITNHGYIDNPTFRGMRWHLMQTFDEIYVLDLHGNSKKKETAPDGSKDENVFDIQQGVAIFFGIKTGEKASGATADVHHAEVYGKREDKHDFLNDSSWQELEWTKLSPQEQYYFFTDKDMTAQADYLQGVKLDELFPENVTGIVTMGDDYAISHSKNELRQRLEKTARELPTEDELRTDFSLGKNYPKFLLGNMPNFEFNDEKLVPITYRPFDTRWTYFDNGVLWRWRHSVMQHFVGHENYGFISKRGVDVPGPPSFISDNLLESRAFSNPGSQGVDYFYPLYLYPEGDTLFEDERERKPNLEPELIEEIADGLGLEFVSDHADDGAGESGTFTPLDILDYCYAVLHSPHYREKYQEFLKIDFPRVPFTDDSDLFFKLAKKGSKLRKLHLLENISSDFATTFPESGSMEVTKYEFEPSEADKDVGKIWINDSQYFGNVQKAVWEFYIGGYQVLRTWLRYRKRDGVTLTSDDIEHLQKVMVSLDGTIELMKEINELTKDF
jgi:predicted helicase